MYDDDYGNYILFGELKVELCIYEFVYFDYFSSFGAGDN